MGSTRNGCKNTAECRTEFANSAFGQATASADANYSRTCFNKSIKEDNRDVEHPNVYVLNTKYVHTYACV